MHTDLLAEDFALQVADGQSVISSLAPIGPQPQSIQEMEIRRRPSPRQVAPWGESPYTHPELTTDHGEPGVPGLSASRTGEPSAFGSEPFEYGSREGEGATDISLAGKMSQGDYGKRFVWKNHGDLVSDLRQLTRLPSDAMGPYRAHLRAAAQAATHGGEAGSSGEIHFTLPPHMEETVEMPPPDGFVWEHVGFDVHRTNVDGSAVYWTPNGVFAEDAANVFSMLEEFDLAEDMRTLARHGAPVANGHGVQIPPSRKR